MSLRRLVPAALLALALLAAPVVAQADEGTQFFPVNGAHSVQAGNATLYYWVGPSSTELDEELEQGNAASLWFALQSGANGTRRVAFVNATSQSPMLQLDDNGTAVVESGATQGYGRVGFGLQAAAGSNNLTYNFTGEVYEEQNGTLVLLGPVSGVGSLTVEVPVAPAPTGIPTSWLVALALLLLGAVVVGAIAYKRSADRKRMNAAPRRSQVMRDMELEQKLEKAKEKDPEQAVQIQQEIRQAEQVRERRRELQILDAKRADALKTLDLLKKRHEAGGLTKLQYDNMAAKKRADLERIEAEIAEMERQDGGAAA